MELKLESNILNISYNFFEIRKSKRKHYKKKRYLAYLHRDNQSSILAISDTTGNVIEQRYIDAWGNLKAYKKANNPVVNVNSPFGGWGDLLLDRGYTAHEHLYTVGLIHMNGRLYDPQLRRFLSPDNYVQDINNTQSFNRFGYVWNNPLMYTDQSGELAFLAVIAIGAAVGILTNGINNIMNGVPFWYGMGKAAVMGAVSGAISFGIGSVATSAATTFIGKAALQAGLHGLSGGLMSSIDGGDFGSGFLSGAISSLVSSGIEGLGNSGVYDTGFKGSFNQPIMSSFGTRNPELLKALMIVGGSTSGGISSSISGGNFMDGFKQGLITSGLNHLAHLTVNGGGDDPKKVKGKEQNKDYKGWGNSDFVGPTPDIHPDILIEKYGYVIRNECDECAYKHDILFPNRFSVKII